MYEQCIIPINNNKAEAMTVAKKSTVEVETGRMKNIKNYTRIHN